MPPNARKNTKTNTTMPEIIATIQIIRKPNGTLVLELVQKGSK